MVRLIRITLFLGCCAAQLFAQASIEQGLAGQASSAEPLPGGPSPATVSGKTQYPLDAFTDFSALMTGSRMAMGDVEVHIYRSGNLMRVEGPEKRGYFITDLSTLETWGISAQSCILDTHPYFRTSPFPAVRPGYTVERVVAGKEMLDGHSCQIEEVKVTSDKPGAAPLKMKLWEAEDLQGFPIKIEFPFPGGKSATIRYNNVVLGPQDPTLFMHPKTCESMPGKGKSKTPKSSAPAKKAPAGDAKK